MSAAILDHLRGALSLEAAADWLNIPVETFKAHLDTFLQGGARALGGTGMEDHETTGKIMALSAVNQMLGTILVLDDLLREAVDVLKTLFGYFPSIGLIQEDTILIKHGYYADESRLESGLRLTLDSRHPMAWCARNGRLLNIPDMIEDSRFNPDNLTNQARSYLVFPLILKGTTLGVLMVNHLEPRHFDSRDVAVLETVSFHLAVAVENALLFTQIDRRVMQLEMFRGIASHAIEARDMETLIQHTTTAAREMMGCDLLGIGILGEQNEYLLLSSQEFGQSPVQQVIALESGTLIAAVVNGISSRHYPNRALAENDQVRFQGARMQSGVCVPLRQRGEMIGVIFAESRHPYAFDTHDISTLKLLADQLSGALNGVSLFEQTQAQLNEIRKFRQLANESNVGIVTRDGEGVIEYANSAAAELFGATSPESLSGRLFNEFVADPEAWAKANEQFTTWAMQLGGWSGEVRLKPVNDQETVVEISIFPIFATNGEFINFGMILQDVTERRALSQAMEQEKLRFEALFESTDNGLIAWDEQWRIVLVNSTAAMYLGVPGEYLESLSRSSIRLLPPLEKIMTADEDVRFELEGKVRRMVRCRHIPWQTTTSSGMLTVIYDETSQAELERQRDDMLHMLVHDLRSPLQSVLNGVIFAQEALDEKHNEVNPARALNYLGKAGRGLAQIMSVADNLLQITKLEAGMMPIQPSLLDVRAVLQEVVDSLIGKTTAARLNADVCVDANVPPLSADGGLLRRALINLYDNAIKFSPPGSTITLAAHTLPPADPNDQRVGVVLSITDAGPGVPESYRQVIFEKYGQAPNQESGQKGTGLGLALCRLVAEAHDGRVWVDVGEQGGSTFHLLIRDTRREAVAFSS